MDGNNQPSWRVLVLDRAVTDVLFAMEQDISPEVVHLVEEMHLWKQEEQVRVQPKVLTNLLAPQQQAYRRTILPSPSWKS